MTQSFSRLYTQLDEWATDANKAGWISEKDHHALRTIETQQAEALFSASGQRPLIVAFFGGTGVGKSSLLNRLAGIEIAKTGVTRPTSTEVTLYLHRDFEIRELPNELPQENTVIRYHDDDRRRLVAWLDLPDIDSTATSHRQQVERWLPYIDWVVYVVSPERYHDDLGWRFVQQRQQHHSWLFIINHWDEGREEQREDFRQRLNAEGFSNPTILTTDCGPKRIEDEFHVLEDTVNSSIRQFGLGFLQSMGGKARVNELKTLASRYSEKLGTTGQWEALHTLWQTHSGQQIDSLKQQLSSSAISTTQILIAEEERNSSLFKKRSDQALLPNLNSQALSNELSETGQQSFAEELTLTLSQTTRDHSLPPAPFQLALRPWLKQLKPRIQRSLQKEADQSLLTPGTPAQRFFYKLSRTLSWVLPLTAACWVVFHAVSGFYLSTHGIQAFLGINFVTHSLLLVGLSWAIPWIIQRQLKPSMAKSLRRGLLNGTQQVAAELKEKVKGIFQQVRSDRQKHSEALQTILAPSPEKQ